MTVVATSTSISPAAKARITASFSPAGSRPCSTPSRSPASGPSRSIAATSVTASGGRRAGRSSSASSSGSKIAFRPRRVSASSVVADLGADHVGLVALADLLAHPLPGPVQPGRLLGGRHHGGGDRRPAGRQFGQRRGVQVAEDRHRDRARDRRRGHHQHMRRVALGMLGAQRIALLDPEPVLLVDHDQPEIGEVHPLGQQRVGADHDAGLAGGDGQQRLLAGLSRSATR